MKKMLFVLGFLALNHSFLLAQDKFFTKSGRILLDATAKNSPEKINAENKSVTCVLDTKTGNIQFAVLMKGFSFERALMQEHFNENYVESDKYPRAEFKGSIISGKPDYSTEGSYPVKVKGLLTIHGQTKDAESSGTITVKQGTITTEGSFSISLADYNISIPSLVADKLSPNPVIKVNCLLNPLKK